MKTYDGVGTASQFFTSALDGEVRGRLHVPAALSPRKAAPRYPLDRRLGGPQSRSRRCEEKNPLLLPGIKIPAVQPIARTYTE
jgi:hypothetical protein